MFLSCLTLFCVCVYLAMFAPCAEPVKLNIFAPPPRPYLCSTPPQQSLVIGFMVADGKKSPLIFIVGVFLSNFPEAVSSAGTMKAAGLSVRRIMTLWCFTFFATGLGALLGAAIMPEEHGEGFELFVKGMEGFAAGAMLTMIAQTMLPEAFHQGGNVVGMSCLCGFLATILVKMVPLDGGEMAVATTHR